MPFQIELPVSAQQHVPATMPDRLVRASLEAHDQASLYGFGLILGAVDMIYELFQRSGSHGGLKPGIRFGVYP